MAKETAFLSRRSRAQFLSLRLPANGQGTGPAGALGARPRARPAASPSLSAKKHLAGCGLPFATESARRHARGRVAGASAGASSHAVETAFLRKRSRAHFSFVQLYLLAC